MKPRPIKAVPCYRGGCTRQTGRSRSKHNMRYCSEECWALQRAIDHDRKIREKLEDYDWLMSQQVSVFEVHRRLGFSSPLAIGKFLRRAGRPRDARLFESLPTAESMHYDEALARIAA